MSRSRKSQNRRGGALHPRGNYAKARAASSEPGSGSIRSAASAVLIATALSILTIWGWLAILP